MSKNLSYYWATSGLGKMALTLSKLNYNLILIGNNKKIKKLRKLYYF